MWRLLLLSLLSFAGLSTGCAICSSCHDEDYGYYGGTWQRHNPSHGRVGSAFDDAGGSIVSDPPPEVLDAPLQPTPSDSPESSPDDLPPPEEMTEPEGSSPQAAAPRPLMRSARPRAWTRQRDYLP